MFSEGFFIVATFCLVISAAAAKVPVYCKTENLKRKASAITAAFTCVLRLLAVLLCSAQLSSISRICSEMRAGY
jgi:hypothetical protein